MAYATDEYGWLDATEDANLVAHLQSGKVFPSLLGATADATIQAIGFQGEGAVDDIVMSEGNPFPPPVSIGSTSYDSLEDALAEAEYGDTITLLQDITLTQGLVFDSNVAPNVTLDLSGHTLSYPTGTTNSYMITVYPENWLSVTNGTLATTGRGAFVQGGLELLADTSLTSGCRALNIVGVDDNLEMPTICIIDAGATVTHGNGDDVAVFVRGSASGTRQFWGAWAILDVYGTLIDAATTPGQYGITGNGGNATLAEINFYDGSVYTFADTTRPMMWLSSNDLNLYGGTLSSAGGGIFVLCGKVNVPGDSTVTVTANGPAGAYVSYSGNDYTGDALYFAAEGARYPRSQYKDTLPEGWGVDQIEANIAGGTFTSVNGEGIAAYVDPDRNDAVALTNFVWGGLYSSEPAAALLAPKHVTKTVSDPAGYYTVCFSEPSFSVDWDTDADASLIWGTTAPTAAELESIKAWATANNIADPNGKLGLESYLLGCTSVLAVDPVLHIDAIEQAETGWTITVSASAGETAIPLSDAINGTLKVRYAADLATGPWTDATYSPTFANGTATVTVTAEGAKFIKAAITR